MKSDHTPPPPRLPLMRNPDEAEALYQKHNDPFYLAAFLFQHWLGGLLQRAAAQYAEKKNPRDRSLQQGEAWRAFADTFPSAERQGCRYLLSCLFRFCLADTSPRNALRRALLALSIEHRLNPRLLDPNPVLASGADDLARHAIVRCCDWLEAAIHLRLHRHWHAAPGCFDPDPEIRTLASLGNAQRHLAKLDSQAQAAWLLDLAAAAQRYQDSPKWAALGKAMADDSDRLWTYADVDTLVIALWPLVKQYRWTYRDLLNVIRPGLKRPRAYPCGREQDFATYCANVLGLKKPRRGVTAKSGRPLGHEIAAHLCPGLSPKSS